MRSSALCACVQPVSRASIVASDSTRTALSAHSSGTESLRSAKQVGKMAPLRFVNHADGDPFAIGGQVHAIWRPIVISVSD